MTYKGLMLKTLTGLLKDDETLMHPIYGLINQGNVQYYGYLGFTENYLLIAFISGKHVVGTARISLADMKLVNIKASSFFKQYIIEITFNEITPYRITAAQNVLTIDSQKDNLSHFLSYLKNKSPKTQANKVKEIGGEKIRWQYFNTYIYAILTVIPMVPIMILISEIKEGNFDVWEMLLEMSGAIPVLLTMYGALLGPFILLSVCNRFFFGKILGVVSDKTLFLGNQQISLKHIKKIVYNPRVWTRYRINYTFATIFVASPNGKEHSFDVLHFPFYGLNKIKKYNPDIKVEIDKRIWLLIFMPSIVSTVLALIFL